MGNEESHIPTSTVRVIVHAVVSNGDVYKFTGALKGALAQLLKDDVIKDVQLLEENVKITLPWGALRKSLKE